MKTKYFFLLAMAFFYSVFAGAQNESMPAILQHGDEVSAFKGK